MINQKIYVCSPLGADTEEGIEINRKAAIKYSNYIKDVLHLEPKLLHSYLPLCLNDNDPSERRLALRWGIELLTICQTIAVCGDKISNGMRGEIEFALNQGIPVLVFSKVAAESLDALHIPFIYVNDEFLATPSQKLGKEKKIYTNLMPVAQIAIS